MHCISRMAIRAKRASTDKPGLLLAYNNYIKTAEPYFRRDRPVISEHS